MDEAPTGTVGSVAADVAAGAEVDRLVLSTLPVGIVVHDRDGRILRCNTAAERILGLSEAQMMGRTPLDPHWRAVHEDGSDFPGETHPASEVLRTGRPVDGVIMGVHKPDGTLTWISITASPAVGTAVSSAVAVSVAFTDVTEQVMARRAARDAEERFRLLAENASDVVFTAGVDRRVTWIAPTVTRALGYDPAELIGTRIADLWRPDARREAEPDRARLYAGEEPPRASGYLFELRTKAGDYRWMSGNAHPLKDGDGATVGVVAGMRDVTDLVRATERREAILHTMLDYHVLLSPVRDAHGALRDFVFADLNDNACRRLGRERADLTGASASAVLPGRGGARVLALFEPVLVSGEPLELNEVRMDSVVGSPLWFDVRAVKVGDQVSCTWRDVTDDHLLRQRVEQSETRFRLMAENATDIVFHSVDGVTEWVSPSLTAVAGWLPEELIGGTTAHLWHPDDRDAAVALRDSVYAGGTARGTLRYRTRSGSYVWLDVALQPYPEPDGRTGAVGIMRDVTDRVKAEERLAASEAHYRLLAENATDVVAHVRDGDFVWVSPSMRSVFGWDPEELVGMHRTLEFVHADDVEPLRHALASIDSGVQELRMRVRARNGEYHWVDNRIGTFLGDDGQPDGRIATIRVVDREVAAEEALVETASRDSLTGLLNRREVLERLTAVLSHPIRSGRRAAVAFCDLDDFKTVNDRYGHGAGDEALRVIADRIRAIVRETDQVSRFGGDEILVVLDSVHDEHDARAVAEKMRLAAMLPVPILGGAFTVTLSIGITLATPGDTVDALIARADAAMYAAKNTGKNQVITITAQDD